MVMSASEARRWEKTREAVCAIGLQTRRGQLSDWHSETRVIGRLTFTTTSTRVQLQGWSNFSTSIMDGYMVDGKVSSSMRNDERPGL